MKSLISLLIIFMIFALFSLQEGYIETFTDTYNECMKQGYPHKFCLKVPC